MSPPASLSGKFRGTVLNNLDPTNAGRLQVRVPSAGLDGVWAVTCVPLAGSSIGVIAIPPIGANVWVEFEECNPDLPIWAGCFFGPGEFPAEASAPGTLLVRTLTTKLLLSDADAGSVRISTDTGVTIEATGPSITISNGLGAVVSSLVVRRGSV
jgi:hypothetical protein